MKKIFFLVFPIIILFSCKKHNVDFTSGIEMADIKKMNLTKDKNLTIGLSHLLNQDTIITEYNSKSYSLLVLKFDKINSTNKIKNFVKGEENDYGDFLSIKQSTFEVKYNLNTNTKQKISAIDIITDKLPIENTKNDSIVNYNGNFNQFKILINNKTVIDCKKRKTHYGIPDNLSANFLFYKLNSKIYLFIMSPNNPKEKIESKTLYNYLFNNVTSS